MADALSSDGYDRPERRRPRHPRGVRKNEAQVEADFLAPVLATPTQAIRGMVAEDGGKSSIESQAAAVKVLGRCAVIRERIMRILVAEGPQNAHDLEDRVEFRGDGVCTVRKRITELRQAGAVVQVGRKDGCALWGVAGSLDTSGK